MSSPEFRHKAFNINTNDVLDTLNGYLINESADYPPNYTKVGKDVDKTIISKLKTMLKVVNTPDYKEDRSLDTIRYKLYLCYALINYLEGNHSRAKELFHKTYEFEDHDMAQYYQDIALSTGIKPPKKRKEGNHFRKSLANEVSSWTDEEISRYATLRAIEWVAWPSFISIGLGSMLLAIIPPVQLAIGVVIIDIVWHFISTAIYIYWLSNLGIWLNKLKWLSAPVMAILFFTIHDTRLAIIALLWPLIGIVLTFPSSLISGALGVGNVGRVEQRIYENLESKR